VTRLGSWREKENLPGYVPSTCAQQDTDIGFRLRSKVDHVCKSKKLFKSWLLWQPLKYIKTKKFHLSHAPTNYSCQSHHWTSPHSPRPGTACEATPSSSSCVPCSIICILLTVEARLAILIHGRGGLHTCTRIEELCKVRFVSSVFLITRLQKYSPLPLHAAEVYTPLRLSAEV
jgi:hypothetical protein